MDNDYGACLNEAANKGGFEESEFTGRLAMKTWTRFLPEWAFKLSLDHSLRGLRTDMLSAYRGGFKCPR